MSSSMHIELHDDQEYDDQEYSILKSLQEDCYEQERKDLFLPMFASCNVCKGYVFKSNDDSVVAQLGCCGCLVAAEMEMIELQAPSSPTSPTPLRDALIVARLQARLALKNALQDALISARLDLDTIGGERKTNSPAEHYYLHSPRRQPKQRKILMPTTQMKTRNRQTKGMTR